MPCLDLRLKKLKPSLDWLLAFVPVVAEISRDGETNWLEGVQLLSVYLILAILFYFLRSKALRSGLTRTRAGAKRGCKSWMKRANRFADSAILIAGR